MNFISTLLQFILRCPQTMNLDINWRLLELYKINSQISDSLFFQFSCSYYTWCQGTKIQQNIQIWDPTSTPISLFTSFISEIYSFSCAAQNSWSIVLNTCISEDSQLQSAYSIGLINKERVLAHQTESPELRNLQDQSILWSAMSLRIQVPSPFHCPIFTLCICFPIVVERWLHNSRFINKNNINGWGEGEMPS